MAMNSLTPLLATHAAMSKDVKVDRGHHQKTPLINRRVPSEEAESAVSWFKKDVCFLYCDAALSTWGDRMWKFCVSIFLASLGKSLRLTAVYGFATGISATIFGAAIGKWIDNTPRLRDVNAMISRIDLISLICAPLVLGQVMSYSQGLKGIQNSSNVVAAICIAVWNVTSVCVQYKLITLVYRATPDLAFRKPKPTVKVIAVTIMQASNGPVPLENKAVFKQPEETERERFCRYIYLCCSQDIKKISIKLSSYTEGWRTYLKQDVLAAGIGLSLLFMTVLSIDNVTLGYAKLQGIPESLLGSLSAISALSGILGTVAYPFLRSRIGIERTGMCGYFFKVTFLSACVISLWLPGSPFEPNALFSSSTEVPINDPSDSRIPKHSVVSLMTGIVTARFGYWVVYLSVIQILQERVYESYRGTVFGTQSSINNSMSTLKYALVILLPDPTTFGYLIITSFIFVCLGWMAFTVYSYKQQGSLFQVKKFTCPEVFKHSQTSTETVPELLVDNAVKNAVKFSMLIEEN